MTLMLLLSIVQEEASSTASAATTPTTASMLSPNGLPHTTTEAHVTRYSRYPYRTPTQGTHSNYSGNASIIVINGTLVVAFSSSSLINVIIIVITVIKPVFSVVSDISSTFHVHFAWPIILQSNEK